MEWSWKFVRREVFSFFLLRRVVAGLDLVLQAAYLRGFFFSLSFVFFFFFPGVAFSYKWCVLHEVLIGQASLLVSFALLVFFRASSE